MKTEIDGFLKNSVVLIDTCSIVEVSDSKAHSERFWEKLLSMAHDSGAKVIISSGVLRELDSHQSSKNKPENLKKASALAMKKLYSLMEAEEIYAIDDHVNTRAEDGRIFADPFFINFVNNYKMSKNIYIFTQDINLMKDIHAALRFDSLSGKVKRSNGEQVTIATPKKVTVVKIQPGKPDLFKRFFPDRTLTIIAEEIGQSVDECAKRLKEITGKQIEPNDTLSRNYENRLKEAFGLIPERNGQNAREELADSVKPEAPKIKKKSALPAFKSIGG